MAEESSSEVVKEQSEVVAAANLKVSGDGPTVYQNLAYGNAVAHQQSMQLIQQATVAKMVELIANTSPSEGGVDVAGMQALSKIVGNIPPTTP